MQALDVAYLRESKEAGIEGLREQIPQSNSISLEPINALRKWANRTPKEGKAGLCTSSPGYMTFLSYYC